MFALDHSQDIRLQMLIVCYRQPTGKIFIPVYVGKSVEFAVNGIPSAVKKMFELLLLQLFYMVDPAVEMSCLRDKEFFG